MKKLVLICFLGLGLRLYFIHANYIVVSSNKPGIPTRARYICSIVKMKPSKINLNDVSEYLESLIKPDLKENQEIINIEITNISKLN